MLVRSCGRVEPTGDGRGERGNTLALSPVVSRRARRGALEKDNRQGGQSDGQGKRPAVSGNSDGLDAAQIPPAAAAIILGVAVEQLLPVTSARDPHSIVRARHRG